MDRVDQARAVLRHSPELTHSVLSDRTVKLAVACALVGGL
jgi:hypothetical protein